MDTIVPYSEYTVSCGLADVLEQPESRRRKQNITYRIRQSDWPEIHLPNHVLTLATKMQVWIDQIERPRLEVFLQNLLEIRQPRPEGVILLSITNTFETKIRQRDIDRIRGYLGSSLFRGKIIVIFRKNNLENDVLTQTYSSPPSETVTRTFTVQPLELTITIVE